MSPAPASRPWPLRRLLLASAVLALPAAAAALFPPPASAQAADAPLAIIGARIYPSPDAMPIFAGTVVVTGGKIVAVGKQDEVAIPAGARTLDATGLVVTAGFQNSHVHFTEPKWIDAAHQPAARLGEQLAAMLTRYGFTTVVDTASLLPNTTALRRRIEAGEVAGPRILTAGEGLYPPDGIPYYLKGEIPDEILALLPQPSTPAEATAIARQHSEDGSDVLKLFTGSWVERGRVKPMPEDVATAAAAEAHRHGQLVFSHASNLAGLEVALAARVDILAHALDDMRGVTPDHFRRMQEQGMALVPTLKLFGGDRWLFEILDAVRDYARSGGPILFGTDVGYLPDYDPTAEYVLLGTAGLSWREILASLTTAPVARFGESERRGRIAPGLDADLVVLGTDPATDVRAFADVRHTLRGGKVIYSAPAAKP